MFTGIIAEKGVLKRKVLTGEKYKLIISAKKVLYQVEIGDSIAVNGVCLTVVNYTDRYFEADIMPATLAATNLNNLKEGELVNLEQAVRANGFLGGHLVTGHIDGTGKVIKITNKGNARLVEISIENNLEKFMIDKGSVALNGVSLTIYKLKRSSLIVSLIPETWQKTNLKYIKKGDLINIETDIIGKYVAKFLDANNNSYQQQKKDNVSTDIDKNFLQENGFL